MTISKYKSSIKDEESVIRFRPYFVLTCKVKGQSETIEN